MLMEVNVKNTYGRQRALGPVHNDKPQFTGRAEAYQQFWNVFQQKKVR